MSEQPSNPDIIQLKQQVTLLAENGEMAKALEQCQALTTSAPADPEVWFLMGAIYGGMSEYEKAKQSFLRILPLAPQHPALNYNLATALLHLGETSDAILHLETAIQSQPDYIDAYRELANAQSLNKQFEDANKNYKKVLEFEPESATTHYNYANTLRDQKDFKTAIEHYQIAISIQPNSIDFHNQLCVVLLSCYKYAQAIKTLENAIKRFPESAELHFKLAIAHQDEGDSENALLFYRKTLDLDGNHIDAQVGLASIRGLEGDYTSASKSLENILDTHPDLPSALITYGQYAHQCGNTQNAISIITHAIKNNEYKEATMSRLNFTLGDLYEKSGETENAFDHYQTGNRLRGAYFDQNMHEQAAQSIINVFSATNMPSFPKSTDASPTPIFIVGMPRSGTSLAEQILASHSSIYGAGELPYIENIIHDLANQENKPFSYPKDISNLDQNDIEKSSGVYLAKLRDKSGSTQLVTDKMPSNFWHLGFISLLFPNAKIIHCIRNPIDTCLSCYFKHFSGEHTYAYNQESLGHYYKIYEQLMAHWNQVLPLPIYPLYYEKLIDNPEYETRQLIDFCDLPWDASCLDFHKTKRTVSTASHDQVRKPIYKSSLNRWKKYEQHLSPLLKILEP